MNTITPDNTTTQVDFYHLDSDSAQQMQIFCCRLVDKAWQLGHSVCILTADAQQAEQLDELLWSWRDDSFLPHQQHSPNAPADTGVNITHLPPTGLKADLLVNLGSDLTTPASDELAQFTRIAEIINQDPFVKQHGRIRYSYYDKNNYSLKYHEITSG